jgi:hypothetical protein
VNVDPALKLTVCTSRLKVCWPSIVRAKLPVEASTVTVCASLTTEAVVPWRSVVIPTSNVESTLGATRVLRASFDTHSSCARFRPARRPPKVIV